MRCRVVSPRQFFLDLHRLRTRASPAVLAALTGALFIAGAGARADEAPPATDASGPVPIAQSTSTASSTPAAASNPGPDAPAAVAAKPGPFAPQSIWINPGVFSEHFNQNMGFRQDNWGFGAQVNLPNDVALLGGEFINSDNARSHDFGVLWQPLELGWFKLGAVAGGFDGYPHYHNGGWFPALLPMASVSYGIVGANFTVIPNYGNRLHGAFVVQLLLRVW